VFASGIDGVFVLDDHRHIVEKESIRSLWPPWTPLTGTTRPLVQATIALNYAISGLNPWSYHVLNIALHLGATLALFGLARRTLARFPATSESASGLAAAGATVWAVHPLQTESVTYIIQRAEVAMGLAIYLMLYCFSRATDSPKPSRWLVYAVLACLLGYAAKPIMIIAPVLLWLFDRQFVSGTFRGAIRARPRFYLALFLTPLILPLFLAGNTAEWKDSAGVGTLPVTWYEYAVTQPEILLHYLRLVVWPAPLCLDYGWPVERSPLVIAATSLIICSLLALTLWALKAKRTSGFLAAWFFINLAPTSSVVPITDLAFEHRMYLALAALVFAAVLAVHRVTQDRAPQWLRPALAIVAVAFFSTFTVIRNRDYSSAIRLWAGNVAARPEYARARNNLGLELGREGRFEEAIVQLRRAVELKPGYAIAHYNLGKALLGSGQAAEARLQLETALKLAPNDFKTHAELGRAFQQLGDANSAVAHFANATRLNQGDLNSWLTFASALIDIQRYADAVKVLDQASRSHKDSPEVFRSLAIVLASAPDDRVRDAGRALSLARQAVVMTGGHAASLDALAMAQAEGGDFDAAIKTAEHALSRAREQGATPADIASMEARIVRYRSRQPWRLDSLAPRNPN
jgi:protein O-mannosyl-transferase